MYSVISARPRTDWNRMFVIKWGVRIQSAIYFPIPRREMSAKCTVWACRAQDVVGALTKRLSNRNANVQLYTLEVCTPRAACGRH